MKTLLLVSENQELRAFFTTELPRCGIDSARDFQGALTALERDRHDFVFAEIGTLRAAFPSTPLLETHPQAPLPIAPIPRQI